MGIGLGLVCLCTVVAAPAVAGSSGSHPSEAQNHQAALRDGSQLLKHTPLPSAARPSSTEPAGDQGVLSGPAFRIGITNLVYAHAWWTVNEPQAGRVFKFEKSSQPKNATPDTTCGPMDQAPHWTCVSWIFPPRPGVLGTRELIVKMVGLGHGTTGIRADTEVQWIVPRPASERVPHRVHVIQVVERVPGKAASFSTVLTQASQVHRVVELTNQLPTLQPADWMCPRLPDGHPFVTLTFRASKNGPVLARARQEANDSEAASNTGCFAMSFQINGQAQPALINGTRFLRNVGRVIGAKLTR